MSDDKKKKKSFMDYFKNPNVEKLKKKGYDRYGRHTDDDAKYKAKAKKEFKGYADGGMAKKAKDMRDKARQSALLIIIGGGKPKKK